MVIPSNNYQRFKGKRLLLKASNVVLTPSGADTAIKWDSYTTFSVVPDLLPFEIIEDVQNYLFITTPEAPTVKLNYKLVAGT